MKEEDIRPDNLVEEQAKLIDDDIENLLKYKAQFVDIPCPACESNNYYKLFKKKGFNFVKCKYSFCK